MTDSYRACLDFLYGRLNYERVEMPRMPVELRLGRMRRLLRRLGDPQDALRIVHIAGTKGKGSTAAMIASALTAGGYKTGLFCSPHLHRLEERFQVDGRAATPEQLMTLVEEVRSAATASDLEEPARGLRGPTFFEVATAMGLLHFANAGTGAVVLEVGLGGRLDSTNAVRPELAVITTISYDHTKQLGNTFGAIAREKAGIIKRRRPVVSGVSGAEAGAVIRDVAAQRKAPLREVGTDYSFTYRPPAQPVARPTPGRFRVETWRTSWGELELPLLGAHQAGNAAVALAALDALAESSPLAVDLDAVRRGLGAVRFPARVEVMGENPWTIVDGAHNVASAEALAETLRTCIPAGPRTLIFGTTREKDLRGQLRALLPLFDRVIATRYIENPRSVPLEEVSSAVEELGGPAVSIEPGPAEALAEARRITPEDGVICVTGSLFLAAECRAILSGSPAPPDLSRALI